MLKYGHEKTTNGINKYMEELTKRQKHRCTKQQFANLVTSSRTGGHPHRNTVLNWKNGGLITEEYTESLNRLMDSVYE